MKRSKMFNLVSKVINEIAAVNTTANLPGIESPAKPARLYKRFRRHGGSMEKKSKLGEYMNPEV